LHLPQANPAITLIYLCMRMHKEHSSSCTYVKQ